MEIDLIVDRPGKALLMVEIKSTTQVRKEHVKTLSRLAHEFGECEAICLSQDQYAKQYDNVLVLPWQEGLRRYF